MHSEIDELGGQQQDHESHDGTGQPQHQTVLHLLKHVHQVSSRSSRLLSVYPFGHSSQRGSGPILSCGLRADGLMRWAVHQVGVGSSRHVLGRFEAGAQQVDGGDDDERHGRRAAGRVASPVTVRQRVDVMEQVRQQVR